MSDHSDLVARLRNAAESSEQFLDGRAALLYDASDALDVKPGANAYLIAETRNLAKELRESFDARIGGTALATMLEDFADALETAASRARALPTREQILDRVRQVARDEEGQEDGDSIAFCERVTDAVLALFTGGKADA